MKILSILGFVATLFTASSANAAAPACDFHFATQNLCASFQWVNEPAHNGAGSFHLSFWDQTQMTADAPALVTPANATVSARLFMSSMGHGGGLVKVAQTLDAQGQPLVGQFDATQVRFVMAGPWEIIVELKDENGTVKDSAQINYRAH